MYDLMLESLFRFDQAALNTRERKTLMDAAKGLISKLLKTVFDQSKDKADADIQVVEILERFFSHGNNRELVDYLIAEIFDTYEPSIKLLSQGKPDRIVSGLFSLKVIQPNDFI